MADCSPNPGLETTKRNNRSDNQIIRIYDRSFWVVERREVIEFQRINEIIYAYEDLFPGNSWLSHDAQDLSRLAFGSTTAARFPYSGIMAKENS